MEPVTGSCPLSSRACVSKRRERFPHQNRESVWRGGGRLGCVLSIRLGRRRDGRAGDAAAGLKVDLLRLFLLPPTTISKTIRNSAFLSISFHLSLLYAPPPCHYWKLLLGNGGCQSSGLEIQQIRAKSAELFQQKLTFKALPTSQFRIP